MKNKYLKDLADGGDLDALIALLRQSQREGDLDTLRAVAFLLIEGGAAHSFPDQINGESLRILYESSEVVVNRTQIPILSTEKRIALWACDCAARVLHIYEKSRSQDDLPHRLIRSVRRCALGLEVGEETFRAVRSIANQVAKAAFGGLRSRAAIAVANASFHAAIASIDGARLTECAAAAANYACDAVALSRTKPRGEEQNWQLSRLFAYLMDGVDVDALRVSCNLPFDRSKF